MLLALLLWPIRLAWCETPLDDPPPDGVIPVSYDLTVRFPLEVEAIESFSASLVLHFILARNTSLIHLDAHELSAFRNVTLARMDGRKSVPRGIRIRKESVEFKFDFLLGGEYILSIGEYVGRVGDGSASVFRRGRSILTHLQPSFARRLLPCVDKPYVRAVFRVTVVHPQTTRAYSNTASVEERLTDDGKMMKTTFSGTPSLPAYLLAFSVLPDSFLEVSAQTSFGVTVRVIGEHKDSVLRTLSAALPAFENIATMMGIPLPLNKMDMLLVAEYEGGMENWGQILLSESLAATADDAHLLHLVTHELVHHWVGNAATVSTWAHICLQEDLTELLTHKVLKKLLRREDFERFRLAKYIEIQLAEDIVSPGQPLVLPPLISPQMIWTHCYLKGVILLETIEDFIGETNFLTIIRDMVSGSPSFNLLSFSSFLEKFPITQNITLSQLYYHWFTTGGYPMVKVTKTASSVRVDQLGPGIWPLRLSFTDGSKAWQFGSSYSMPIGDPKKSSHRSSFSPFLLNTNFSSFMRVNYDRRSWDEILSALESSPTKFTPVARAQMISDLCFFSTTQSVDSQLIERVMDIVYTQPEHFHLCDWSLLWCRNSLELSASAILQRAVVNLSSFFSSASDYSCRSGEAILAVNKLCLTLFKRQCI